MLGHPGSRRGRGGWGAARREGGAAELGARQSRLQESRECAGPTCNHSSAPSERTPGRISQDPSPLCQGAFRLGHKLSIRQNKTSTYESP